MQCDVILDVFSAFLKLAVRNNKTKNTKKNYNWDW